MGQHQVTRYPHICDFDFNPSIEIACNFIWIVCLSRPVGTTGDCRYAHTFGSKFRPKIEWSVSIDSAIVCICGRAPYAFKWKSRRALRRGAQGCHVPWPDWQRTRRTTSTRNSRFLGFKYIVFFCACVREIEYHHGQLFSFRFWTYVSRMLYERFFEFFMILIFFVCTCLQLQLCLDLSRVDILCLNDFLTHAGTHRKQFVVANGGKTRRVEKKGPLQLAASTLLKSMMTCVLGKLEYHDCFFVLLFFTSWILCKYVTFVNVFWPCLMTCCCWQVSFRREHWFKTQHDSNQCRRSKNADHEFVCGQTEYAKYGSASCGSVGQEHV